MENPDDNDFIKSQTTHFKFEEGLLNRVEILNLDIKKTDLRKFLEVLGLVKRKEKAKQE